MLFFLIFKILVQRYVNVNKKERWNHKKKFDRKWTERNLPWLKQIITGTTAVGELQSLWTFYRN